MSNPFPNPLQINFGAGNICISRWKQGERRGLMFREASNKHEVGEYANTPRDPNYEPKEGEVYLTFSNAESLRVVMEELQLVLDEFTNPTA